MKFHEHIARLLKSKHSDTIALIRYGKNAKRATRRRQRRQGKRETNEE